MIWCQKDQTNVKLQKWYYFDEFGWIWCQNDQNNAKLRSDQIIMHCIDLTSERSKTLRYVAKLQKWSNYNELHRFDIKTIKNVELRRKTFKTTQNYKSDQIIMNCIDLTSKRSKLLSYVAKLQNDQIIVHCIDLTSKRSKTLRYVAKHWKQRKTTKLINYNELHWLEVKTIRKPKTTNAIK